MGSLHTTCSLAKRVCKVDVSFCHDGLVKSRKLANHLWHGLFQQVLLFTLFYVLFTKRSHTVQHASGWWVKRHIDIRYHSQGRNVKFLNGMKNSCVIHTILLQLCKRGAVMHEKVTQMKIYLIGSERKQRPHARRTFCHRLSAAMALLNVTGIGLSPRWNLQNGTCPAYQMKKHQLIITTSLFF